MAKNNFPMDLNFDPFGAPILALPGQSQVTRNLGIHEKLLLILLHNHTLGNPTGSNRYHSRMWYKDSLKSGEFSVRLLAVYFNAVHQTAVFVHPMHAYISKMLVLSVGSGCKCVHKLVFAVLTDAHGETTKPKCQSVLAH